MHQMGLCGITQKSGLARFFFETNWLAHELNVLIERDVKPSGCHFRLGSTEENWRIKMANSASIKASNKT
jgi:hypothetical protein